MKKVTRYSNGEPILKKKEADEPWAIDYAILMETWVEGDSIEDLRKRFLKDYKSLNDGYIYQNEEQLLRWCVQIIERMARFTYCEKKKDACGEVEEFIKLRAQAPVAQLDLEHQFPKLKVVRSNRTRRTT